MRLIALIGGFALFCLGIWLLVSGIKADGTVDLKSAVLSGTLRTESAGLYVCFFAVFIVVISLASAHFEKKNTGNENPRQQRMFGLFLILLFALFVSILGHAITGDLAFTFAYGALGPMLIWTVMAILRD